MMRTTFAFPFVALLAASAAAPARAPAALDSDLAATAAAARPGRLGAAVEDVATGRVWAVAGDERFAMQSVFKLPLAIALLSKVDKKELSLQRRLVLRAADMRPGSGPIDRLGGGRSRIFTVGALLEAMLVDSDNSAAEGLLPLAGGPAGVTGFLRLHGLAGIRIDRGEPPPPGPRRAAGPLPDPDDPRDTATPRAAIRLLDALAKGRLLSKASTTTVLGLMERSRTGVARLKAGLPPGSRIAHKTGSSGTSHGVNLATNDIGIVTLPSGRKLLVAAFLKGSTAGPEQREAVLAAVARAAVSAVD